MKKYYIQVPVINPVAYMTMEIKANSEESALAKAKKDHFDSDNFNFDVVSWDSLDWNEAYAEEDDDAL